MSYLPLADATSVTGAARDVLVETSQRWGFVPNIVRALALRPEILDAEDHWTRAVMHTGLLPRGLKEAVATTVSAVNRTEYCATSHALQARRAGVPKGAVAACRTFDFAAFDEAGQAALAFAAKAAGDMRSIGQADMDHLLRHFSRAQVVELAAVVGSFMMYNTFVTVLGLQLEPEQVRQA